MTHPPGTRAGSVLLIALLLLALPCAARADVYALPAAIVTVPVTVLAVLICWPIKASVSARRLAQPYGRVLGVQCLSSALALALFILVQVVVSVVPSFVPSDIVRALIRPLAMLYWMGTNAGGMQWHVIIAGVCSILALSVPSWLLEVRLLRAPAEDASRWKTALIRINLACYSAVALANGVLLYVMAADCIGE